MIAAAALATLKPFSKGAEALVEAGRDFIFLPGLQLTVKGNVRVVDALLRPGEMDGYATRLFLSEPVPEFTKSGWTTKSILGRTWHTPSWRDISANLPLPQMLVAHMAIYR